MATSAISKEKPTALGRFSASLDQILKIVAAFAALAYAFGLVVVNIHLGRYGYHSLGLLQLDYVAAGFWSLFPIAMLGFLIFTISFSLTESYLFQENNSSEQTDTTNKTLKSNEAVMDKIPKFVAGFIIWLVVVFFLFHWLGVTFNRYWILAMILGLFVAGIGFMPIPMAGVKRNRDIILLGAMLIWSIVFLPFYLIVFGQHVYETIPDVWGGGKGAEVVLVAKDDNSRMLIESVDVQFVDARKSVPVRLILATEKYLLIAPAQQARGLKLDSSLVVAVLYNK